MAAHLRRKLLGLLGREAVAQVRRPADGDLALALAALEQRLHIDGAVRPCSARWSMEPELQTSLRLSELRLSPDTPVGHRGAALGVVLRLELPVAHAARSAALSSGANTKQG